MADQTAIDTTGDDATRVFLLSEFICSSLVTFYSAPVSLVATPSSENPCYATTTFNLMPSPSVPDYSDVQITLFTGMPNGSPAPNISFDWRCRVPVEHNIF